MNKNVSDYERRNFIKKCLLVGASALVLPALQRKEAILSAIAEEKLVSLSEKDPTAQALGYAEVGSKVDGKKWPKRAGTDGKTQFCDNCMFYSEVNKSRGKCQIFPGKTVAAKGWCNSWAKKS